MIVHRSGLLIIPAFLVLLLGAAMSAMAATNTVAPSALADTTRPITANDLKPAACASLNLTQIIVGMGAISGGNGSALILGSPADDAFTGKGGSDCMIGGGGSDSFKGGSGKQNRDICLGGPGADTFSQCEIAIQ